ncbi:hypothetical protein [Bradyrhizobium genosp. A]|uniref:hypothetical protein n=1 Tax=Bradyrhizobium genosp. A TaxID=83626 RepID=UPI003CFB0F50
MKQTHAIATASKTPPDMDQPRDTLEEIEVGKAPTRKAVPIRRRLSDALIAGLKSLIKSNEKYRAEEKLDIQLIVEKNLVYYYKLQRQDGNPSAGYDVPKSVITQKELRALIAETAAALVDRLSTSQELPFPILSEAEVKEIIAYAKMYQWDARKEQGWPYHVNAFLYLHIIYRKWVNRGLTREILAWADPSLHAHLKTKISRQGLPVWLDLPSGPEGRARAITDPAKRAELEIVRKVLRDRTRKHRAKRASAGD